MNSTDRLKAQVRAAQNLISQFEEGHGRHNSNLALRGRDGASAARIIFAGTPRDKFSECQRGDFVLCKPDDPQIHWLAVNVGSPERIMDENGYEYALVFPDRWQFERTELSIPASETVISVWKRIA